MRSVNSIVLDSYCVYRPTIEDVHTHVIMLMIATEIGRQNSGSTCKGYMMNVHNNHLRTGGLFAA